MIEHRDTPYTEAQLHDLANRVIKASTAEAVEVVLLGTTSYLTRFANNQIHQNVSEQDLEVQVRVAFGSRVGHGATNDLSPEGLGRALADAETLAKLQPHNPEFPGFALPKAYAPLEATIEATIATTPADRARVVAHVCKDAEKEGLTASGAFTTGLRQVAIANSHGLWAYHQHTLADFNTVVMSDDSSGWAQATSLDARHIDGEALAEEAVDKALRSRRPQ
ncbi:MAG: PmbA/TldA family metallopeptidase, partial [Candidatus Sericytochromatia bacterium]